MILDEIKGHRVRQLDHVEKKEEGSGVKRAYVGRPTKYRSTGCPRYRWKDVMEMEGLEGVSS